MGFSRLSIVVSTHPAQFEAVAYKGQLETNLAKVAGWGYGGVELAVRDPAVIDVGALERTLTNLGLAVPAIGTGQAWSEEKLSLTDPDDGTRQAAINRIKDHIKLGRRLNALVIIGLIRGRVHPGQSHDQALSVLIESLNECVEGALQNGVRLAIEPLNRYETDLIRTADEGMDLIHLTGSTGIGLLLDTFHMNIEEEKIEATIRNIGRNIFHFHVADSNRHYPGGGHLDFSSILHALISTGYKGWVSGEFMPLPDADTASLNNIKFLNSILE